MLGRAYVWFGKDSAAIEELRTAIELQPSLAYAHYSMGFVMISIGHPREATESFDAAARLSPHHPMFWLFEHLSSFACNLNGDYETAIDRAERASRGS